MVNNAKYNLIVYFGRLTVLDKLSSRNINLYILCLTYGLFNCTFS